MVLQDEAADNRTASPVIAEFLVGLTLAVVLAALAYRLFSVIDRYAVNLLLWDAWDFLDGFFHDANLTTSFRWQHGPHREGLGGLIYYFLLPLSSWSSVVEAKVAATLLIAAGLSALWIKRRITGRLQLADVVIPMLFVSTAPSDNLIGIQNLAHGPASTFAVVCLGASFLVNSVKLRVILAVLLNFLAIHTGFAWIVGFLTPGVFLLDYRNSESARDRRWLLSAGALSVFSLLILFLGWTHYPAPWGTPRDIAQFPILVLGRALGVYHDQFGSNPGLRYAQFCASAAAFLVVVAVFLKAAATAFRTRRGSDTSNAACPDRSCILIALFSAFSLLFAFLTGVGRSFQGIEGALLSRYITYSYPAILAVYLAARCWTRGVKTQRIVAATLVLLFFLRDLSFSQEVRDFSGMRDAKLAWARCYLQTESVPVCNDRVLSVHPRPAEARVQEKLEYLKARHSSFFRRLNTSDEEKP